MHIDAGTVNGYLSKRQMVAFLELCDQRGMSKGQLAKEAIVRMLIEDTNRIDERELDKVYDKQQELTDSPTANRKDRYLEEGWAEEYWKRNTIRPVTRPAPAPVAPAATETTRPRRRRIR